MFFLYDPFNWSRKAGVFCSSLADLPLGCTGACSLIKCRRQTRENLISHHYVCCHDLYVGKISHSLWRVLFVVRTQTGMRLLGWSWATGLTLNTNARVQLVGTCLEETQAKATRWHTHTTLSVFHLVSRQCSFKCRVPYKHGAFVTSIGNVHWTGALT